MKTNFQPRKSFLPFLIRILILLAGFVVLVLVANFVIFPIYTRHSAGVKLVNVQNMPLNVAANRLRGQGLIPVRRSEKYSMQPEGTVIYQTPQPGIKVKPDRRIYLDISRGKAFVHIPELIGVSYRQAQVALSGTGLPEGHIRFATRFDTLFPVGVVMEQVPVAGDSVHMDDSLEVWISLGLPREQIAVPEIIRLSEAKADEKLFLSGVKVCDKQYTHYAGVEPDQVIQVTPDVGTAITPDECVTLLITTGEESIEEDIADE